MSETDDKIAIDNSIAEEINRSVGKEIRRIAYYSTIKGETQKAIGGILFTDGSILFLEPTQTASGEWFITGCFDDTYQFNEQLGQKRPKI